LLAGSNAADSLFSQACFSGRVLSAAFFFCEFTVGPMWAIPMDIAPQFSGSASGLMNTGSALAGIISPLVAGYIIDKQVAGTAFIGSIGLLLVGAILAFWMKPKKKSIPWLGNRLSNLLTNGAFTSHHRRNG